MASTAAADCAQALIHQWIARFGVPTHITSDRGAQFTSALWTHLCQQLNITHHPTTAYHPQANGLVERLHRRLKAALRARAATSAWYHHLPWILLSFRTTPAEESDVAPSQSVYGSLLQLPTQLTASGDAPTLELQASTGHQYFPPVPTRHNLAAPPPPPPTIPPALQTASHVLVRRPGPAQPLGRLFDGPYLVLQRSPLTFRLQIGNQSDVIAINRLKPAVLPPGTPAAQPPRRGRPPIIKPPPAPHPASPPALRTSTNRPSSPTGTSPRPTKQVTLAPGTSKAPPPKRGHLPVTQPSSAPPTPPKRVTFAPLPPHQRWSDRRSRPPDRFQVSASSPPASRLRG